MNSISLLQGVSCQIAMSDYPTASDPTSRMQALSERRGELAQQNVAGSNLPDEAKRVQTDKQRQALDDVSARIREQKQKKDNEKRLDDRRMEQTQCEQKQLKKQQAESKQFDVRA